MPHRHPPPHHRHYHRHHHPRRGNGISSLFAETVTGGLSRLLDIAHEFDDLDELKNLLAKRTPMDVPHLDAATKEMEEAGRTPNPVSILRLMACNKALGRYADIKKGLLSGNIGTMANGGATAEDPSLSKGRFAVVFPLPPHVDYIVEEATPGLVFVLPGHHVPHHWEDLEPSVLPTRARKVKEMFFGLTRIAFEGLVDRLGRITTRIEIADLLADLNDAGIRPVIHLHVMLHHPPHHESWEDIQGDYEWREI